MEPSWMQWWTSGFHKPCGEWMFTYTSHSIPVTCFYCWGVRESRRGLGGSGLAGCSTTCTLNLCSTYFRLEIPLVIGYGRSQHTKYVNKNYLHYLQMFRRRLVSSASYYHSHRKIVSGGPTFTGNCFCALSQILDSRVPSKRATIKSSCLRY